MDQQLVSLKRIQIYISNEAEMAINGGDKIIMKFINDHNVITAVWPRKCYFDSRFNILVKRRLPQEDAIETPNIFHRLRRVCRYICVVRKDYKTWIILRIAY